MQKFLSIPITATGETSQLVAVDGIVLIEQASTTTVTIVYGNAADQDVVTLTIGAAMAANDVSVRDRIQDSVIDLLLGGKNHHIIGTAGSSFCDMQWWFGEGKSTIKYVNAHPGRPR